MSGLFNPTVARITLRATLSRRRALVFALPALVLILFTVALKAAHAPSRPWPSGTSHRGPNWPPWPSAAAPTSRTGWSRRSPPGR